MEIYSLPGLRSLVKSIASLPSAKFIGFVMIMILWHVAEIKSFSESCGGKVFFYPVLLLFKEIPRINQ